MGDLILGKRGYLARDQFNYTSVSQCSADYKHQGYGYNGRMRKANEYIGPLYDQI